VCDTLPYESAHCMALLTSQKRGYAPPDESAHCMASLPGQRPPPCTAHQVLTFGKLGTVMQLLPRVYHMTRHVEVKGVSGGRMAAEISSSSGVRNRMSVGHAGPHLLAGVADGGDERRHLVLQHIDQGPRQRHECAPGAVC